MYLCFLVQKFHILGPLKVISSIFVFFRYSDLFSIIVHLHCYLLMMQNVNNRGKTSHFLYTIVHVSCSTIFWIWQEPIPVEQLVQSLCDTKQGYTQFGGLRPFGVSFLFAGWDRNHGFQLYVSDPSGNYGGWKAAAIGANNQAAQSMLKQDYKDDITREEAVKLAIKVLSKTMDSTSLTAEKLELAEIYLAPAGEVKYQVCTPEALGKLLVSAGVTQPAAEAWGLRWDLVHLGCYLLIIISASYF